MRKFFSLVTTRVKRHVEISTLAFGPSTALRAVGEGIRCNLCSGVTAPSLYSNQA